MALTLLIEIIVDSSHADRKSHYGFSVHLNSGSGSCIKISIMFEARKIILWPRQCLLKLGYSPSTPTTLYEDNKSAIHIVHNGNDKGRTWILDIIMSEI